MLQSLESEREENQRLKDLLAERDTKIEELEKEVFLLNQVCNDIKDVFSLVHWV